MRVATIIFWICGTMISMAQEYTCYHSDAQSQPREHSVDMQSLSLELSFETAESKVIGKVTHKFKVLQENVDTIFLDGPGIEVLEVMWKDRSISFSKTGEGVVVRFPSALHWDEEHSITLSYTAKPKSGLYFIGWNDPAQLSRKQIWSQGQAYDNRYWIPMYDQQNDKVVSDIKVRFDSQYNVLSNGLLKEKKSQSNGTTVWHYVMSKSHATYLIMLGIGDYKVKTVKSASGTNINLWYYPDQEDRVDYTYKFMKEMFDFFEEEIGYAYPWESYAQIPVQEFMYGAMENTTATVFGDFFCVDRRGYNDRNYVAVNAHELAHQWFGDMVTARTSVDHWLQESFATHYNIMFERVAFGQDHFDWVRRGAMNTALSAGLSNDLPLAHSGSGSSRVYQKGSQVLEMLKYVVGREAYNRSIKYYLQKHAYGNVDSEDLLIAFHETLGKSLDWFWDDWVYHGGEPSYKVSAEKISDAAGKQFVEFTVEQVHEINDVVGLFTMPIWFQVFYTDGTSDSLQQSISEKKQTVRVPVPSAKTVAFSLFDPNNHVLKRVEFKKTNAEWLAQLKGAPYMLDRYDAVLAMASASVEEKIGAYTEAYAKETFHAVKGAILEQLAASESKEVAVQALINQGLQDKDVQVRKTLLEKMTLLSGAQISTVLSYFDDPDASYGLLMRALDLLLISAPSNYTVYLEKSKNLEGIGRNFRVKWLELAAGYYPEKQVYLDELETLTSSSYEFRSRVNAMEACARLNYCTETVVRNIAQALTSPNGRLRNPAGSALKDMASITENKKLIEEVLRGTDLNSDAATAAKKVLGL